MRVWEFGMAHRSRLVNGVLVIRLHIGHIGLEQCAISTAPNNFQRQTLGFIRGAEDNEVFAGGSIAAAANDFMLHRLRTAGAANKRTLAQWPVN